MSTVPHPFTQKQASAAANPFEHRHAHRRARVGIWAGALLVLVAVGFYVYTLRQKTGVLILEQQGAALTISINGKGVVPQTTSRGYYIPLYAGTYKLDITKGGQLGYTQDIITKPGSTVEIRPSYNLLTNLPASSRSATVEFLRPSLDQTSVYFLGDGGRRLYQYTIGSQQQIPLTDSALSDIRNIQWNGRPTHALVTTGTSLFIQEIDRYNFTSQIRKRIAGPEFKSAAWDPNEAERLAAAYYPGSGEQSLVLTDALFTNIRRIGSLKGLPTPRIVWSPDSMYLALLPQTTEASEQNLWMTDLATNETTQITTTGNVQDVTFNTDATGIMFLTSEDGRTVRKFSALTGKNPRSVPGSSSFKAIAWKNSFSFYEPNQDGSRILLTNVLTGEQNVAVNISNAATIQSMYYYPKTNTLIFATNSSIYSVAVE